MLAMYGYCQGFQKSIRGLPYFVGSQEIYPGILVKEDWTRTRTIEIGARGGGKGEQGSGWLNGARAR